MARPRRFTRDQVAQAALSVVDSGGATALTMRAVADVLGTGAMTLYNYVADRSELEELAVDAVLADLDPETSTAMTWEQEVAAIADDVWRAVRPHPHAVELILARRGRSERFLGVAEATIAALARSGLEGADLLAAFRVVSTHAVAFTLTELTGPVATQKADAAATVAEFGALPADRYPGLVTLAAIAATSDPAEEFHAGLTAILRGLTSK